jgi:hypothetical protein
MAMMCGRDEEPWSNATARWKIVMAHVHCRLWTCAVDNKQQTSSKLKKVTDDLIIKKKKSDIKLGWNDIHIVKLIE